MKKIKSILIASNHLVQTGGTETYTYAIIKELLARGFDVEYFTFMQGDFSTKMEKELEVKFLSKKKYDLILANHNTCVEVLMGFGFIIQTCHGVYPPLEQPSLCANFHVAISQEVQNHLAIKGFVSVVIMNGIDTSKFYPKKKLNKELKNVLSLCQSEDANKFLQRVCDSLGITLFYLNKNTNPVWNVEDLINDVDLVIGLGRSVYEAMACGRPVIIYDNRAYFESFSDGYVVNRLSTSLSHNCSGRFYKLKLTEEMMVDEFKKYNHLDGEILRNFILDDMTIKLVVDKYLNLNDSLQRNLNNFKKNYFLKFIQREYYVRIIKGFLKRN